MNALNSQFVQVALPIMITLAIAAWANKSGIDGVNKRLDDLVARINHMETSITERLDRIEATLRDHGERITRLDERTSPLARR